MGGKRYAAFDATGKDQDELQLVVVEILSAFINEGSGNAAAWDRHFDNPENWKNIHTYHARITRLIDEEMARGKQSGRGAP